MRERERGDIDIDIHKKSSMCSNFYLNYLMKMIFKTIKLTKNMANNISLLPKGDQHYSICY